MKKVNITKYWEKLWEAALFAAIILEEDFDLDENGTPRADCSNWQAEHRAELNRLISKIESGNGTADHADDYKRALSILDEMESEPQHMTLDNIRTALLNRHDRSAWDKAVTAYALDMLPDAVYQRDYMEREPLNSAELTGWLLNGASDWAQYSWSGCSLCYDADIAVRCCTPSEYKRKHGGALKPNSQEDWLDVQARALWQACNRIVKLYHSKEVQ